MVLGGLRAGLRFGFSGGGAILPEEDNGGHIQHRGGGPKRDARCAGALHQRVPVRERRGFVTGCASCFDGDSDGSDESLPFASPG